MQALRVSYLVFCTLISSDDFEFLWVSNRGYVGRFLATSTWACLCATKEQVVKNSSS